MHWVNLALPGSDPSAVDTHGEGGDCGGPIGLLSSSAVHNVVGGGGGTALTPQGGGSLVAAPHAQRSLLILVSACHLVLAVVLTAYDEDIEELAGQVEAHNAVELLSKLHGTFATHLDRSVSGSSFVSAVAHPPTVNDQSAPLSSPGGTGATAASSPRWANSGRVSGRQKSSGHVPGGGGGGVAGSGSSSNLFMRIVSRSRSKRDPNEGGGGGGVAQGRSRFADTDKDKAAAGSSPSGPSRGGLQSGRGSVPSSPAPWADTSTGGAGQRPISGGARSLPASPSDIGQNRLAGASGVNSR